MKFRRILTVFLLISTMLTFWGCKKASVTYLDTLRAEELASEAEDELDRTEFRHADGNWLDDYITLPEGLSDYEIRFATDGNNLNEFGIWHVKSDQIAPLEATLRAYLAESLLRNRSFYDSYIPQEVPKLENAEVRVFGNYVCYAILSEEDKAIFFRTIEDELTEN